MSGHQQAEFSNPVTEELPREARIIAVMSGKGGVGKTNLAVNLSVCFAKNGLKSALVDLDMGLANADLLLDVRAGATLADVVRGTHAIDETMVHSPSGVLLIPGGSGVGPLANLSQPSRDRLLREVKVLALNTDKLVLDCGAGISSNVTAFGTIADCILVVTTCEPTSLADAYAMVKVLLNERVRGRIAILVNMASSRADARRTFGRISKVAERFLKYRLADGGYILHDTAVAHAVRRRMAVVDSHPNSAAAACIATLATRFAGTNVRRVEGAGLLGRVAGFFL